MRFTVRSSGRQTSGSTYLRMMTGETMADLHLKFALQPHGHTEALRTGKIKPDGIEPEFIEVQPLNWIYRRMVREREFDVAEMAICTFLCAMSFNKPMTAIPVLTNRGFFLTGVSVHKDAGIEDPRQLEGKRVGMPSFTMTNTTQGRDLLRTEFGVDTDKVHWVCTEDDHVLEYKLPSHVEYAKGKKLPEMLLNREVDAVLGEFGGPGNENVQQLIPRDVAFEKQATTYKRTGVWPIGHLMALDNDALAKNPWIAESLFKAFAESKNLYVEELKKGDHKVRRDRELADAIPLVGDVMPYGIDSNRKALEAAIDMDVKQHILPEKIEVDPLFAASTRNLVS
jgi:4,5-dihydroxyphthalate decarboxylase